MKVICDERCTGYSLPDHVERPARVQATLARLQAQQEVAIDWLKPDLAATETLLLAHTQAHLDHVQAPTKNFDNDTPAHPGIYEHASRAVGAAMAAMEWARKGETVFSLMRPPGHHALAGRAMGFCYFNNVAVAALAARKAGVKRVAIYDFDVHHGNGTEELLLDRDGFAFYSIHQSPTYPGTGLANRGKNCFNYPMPPSTPREEYCAVLAQALKRLKEFQPDLIGVSAGFDAYAHDPLAQERMEAEDYRWLGEQLRALGVPAFHVLEGGYSEALPDLILAYLKGLNGLPK